MNYENLVRSLREQEKYGWNGWIGTLLRLSTVAITDLLVYKKAIDRMGPFGRLFIQYRGDPRGATGRPGTPEDMEDLIAIMPALEDIDGGRWRPIQEDVLRDLFSQVKELKEDRDSDVSLIEKILKFYPGGDFCSYCEKCWTDKCHEGETGICDPVYRRGGVKGNEEIHEKTSDG